LPTNDRTSSSKGANERPGLTRASLVENAILRRLNGADITRILEAGELVEMPARYVIYRAGEPIHEVFFPFDCVLSVVTRMKGGEEIEVGTIGREGTSGIPLLMGGATTANDCYCQVPGRAVKMSAEHFRELQTRDHKFSALLDRYLQAL